MRRPYLLIAAIVLSFSIATPAWSDDPARQREDQLKAGYLFNFAKFVDWPASVPSDALTICFLGGAGVQQFLSTDAASKRIGTRGLVVRSLREHDTSNGCNVLYVDGSLSTTMPASLNDFSAPILTVSDSKDFTHSGGIIALYTESNRLKFIVNVQNAQRAGLRISSNLLQLASSVEKGDPR
jgi:prepilin-type processing-associated H-X9-DG protein